LKENVKNFMLIFHNLDNKTYGSQCENGILKVVIQIIANNAILATSNNPLVALRGGGRNLVKQIQNQVIKFI
jgi:hypothetical protein